MKEAREKRWSVIADNGAHVWLGRHTDPSEDEIDRFATQLDEQQRAAWLVVREGVYYSKAPLSVIMVRPFTSVDGNWESAKELFLKTRTEKMSE